MELPTQAGWVRPVNEVSLHIRKGESLGLVGESGSGKTMLSLALNAEQVLISQKTPTPVNCSPLSLNCPRHRLFLSVLL